jgi:hypothetical protein
MRTPFLAMLAISALGLVPATAHAGEKCQRGAACYRLVETPPVYKTIDETVQVAPARHVRRHVPAVLQDVNETVVVRKERTVARHIAAEYGTTHEKVMTHPGGKRWVMKRNAHGELVGCWVKTHPTYATVARRVVVRPASVVHETLPAIVQHRTRTVVVEPARTEYDTVPAQYETRQRHVKVANGGQHWQRIRGGKGGSTCGGRGILGGNCRY